MAPVFFIDPLDHLFAAFMFEIHIDIRRLAAVSGDETLKHHADQIGADIGDAQQITQDGIGRRAAPLAQNATRAGFRDNVMNCQKIRRVAQLIDQRQLFFSSGDAPARRPHRDSVAQPPHGPGVRGGPAASRLRTSHQGIHSLIPREQTHSAPRFPTCV